MKKKLHEHTHKIIMNHLNIKLSADSLWFTADTHFFHNNIIKFTSRPFVSVEEMNETLVKNWNSVVSTSDIVYHLGDVAFGNAKQASTILNRLNGIIFLIQGNHEKTVLKSKILRDRFAEIYDYGREIKVTDPDATYISGDGQQLIVLSHYAFEVWRNSHHGSWCLFGHSHGGLPTPDDKLRLDVGVDNPFCNFFPVSYNQIKEYMKKKPFKPINNSE